MATKRDAARQLWALLEPVHAVTYFSPEPLAALKSAGFRGFWMGYFAGRAAPLGAVGADVVHALFYNFSFERVARALPDAWDHASPDAALVARRDGSAATLRRCLGDDTDVERVAELALRVAAGLPPEGRALFAANRSLPTPTDPVAMLWHAATLFREHRGDGHVAALLTAGITGRESHVLHALGSGTRREVYTVARDFTEAEWNACAAALAAKGLADAGGLTEAGTRVTQQIEDVTDELSSEGLAGVTDAKVEELIGLLRPMTSAIVRAGDIPLDSPMGLDLRDMARP